ncbi:MAG: hypothetical protein A3D10_05290 [Omnitrophica WOR_2 bacterium RIFCSPHIGHO2_02_FULL_48_11]|nr:MAG: hypothetical protein A3D10_05290 [Omnitrophica WOR_2 bacterium RIFCSPHIGHO2_02_FULL_48_11]
MAKIFLIVYDAAFKVDNGLFLGVAASDRVILFPLTSQAQLTARLKELFLAKKCQLEIRETAYLLNKTAEQVRAKYLDFIAQLPGRIRHNGKNLKEWFAVDESLSAWWLSLVAEKNTFKSDAFNRLVQWEAILTVLKEEDAAAVFFAAESRKLQAALKNCVQKENREFHVLPTRAAPGIKNRIKEFQGLYYFKHALHVLGFAVYMFIRSWKIRQVLRALPRQMNDPDQLLFVGPYPYFDAAQAKDGVFKNKLYAQLQEALESNQQKILWGLFYVDNHNVDIKTALRYARNFVQKGYNIYFLEEAASAGKQLKVLWKSFLLGIKFLQLERQIAQAHHFSGGNFYPIFKDDWYASFVGAQGYQGLLFYEMFKALFKGSQAKRCLYCCEMHAWEKALITAKHAVGVTVPVFAYQHATVSNMLLNYFNSPVETKGNGNYSLAQPDKIICNGEVPYQYMLESGWTADRLGIGEAIRFGDLKDMVRDGTKLRENIVLVAFSISTQESSAILATVYQALKDLKNIMVWIKPHPFTDLKKVFELAGLDRDNFPFEIKNDPVESLLPQAKIVIVGESSVSLVALSFGCEIVLLNVPEWINMSPLRNIAIGQIRTASSPEELAKTVLGLCHPEVAAVSHAEETNQIINKFFCLNKNSAVPQRLLKLLEVYR